MTTIPRPTSPDCAFESLWLECLTRLARGTGRDVYEIPGHPDKVLKVSNCQSNFSNWAEVIIYDQFKEKDDLAKLYSWSWSGRFLVMERLSPLSPEEFAAHTFPNYLTDRKRENYGKDSAGKVKALDYAAFVFTSYESSFI